MCVIIFTVLSTPRGCTQLAALTPRAEGSQPAGLWAVAEGSQPAGLWVVAPRQPAGRQDVDDSGFYSHHAHAHTRS